MASKIEQLYEKYAGNTYPAMLDALAAELGVTAESLHRLQLGWAPIVEFKHSTNFRGWWAIPERDATGKVIGIGLRSWPGAKKSIKVKIPGSNNGLIYEVNPHHERGSAAYQHGAHNWIRTLQAGRDCPVCGKPDGCLISSENPDDPRAAVCIRQRDGADRPMGLGYLHILKEEGKLKFGASVLPANDKPVIVVEGMSDTAAAMDLGFTAVGRPNNLITMGLADLLRGRSVVIIGENDPVNPATGKSPGTEGMIATFQVLRQVCSSVRMALPPEHVKDLRAWKQSTELTADTVLAYVEEHGYKHEEETVLPDNKPLTMARAWLNNERRIAGRYTLRYHKDQWYRYNGDRYVEVDEKTEIRGPLYGWTDNKFTADPEGAVRPVICGRNLVGNVLDALLTPGLCPLNSEDFPCWINGVSGPGPTDVIPFSNGLLNVPAYLDGADPEEYLISPTPDYFTTFALPFPFDAVAKCDSWRAYLESTLAYDPINIDLLQEWFGYSLTPDMSKQKFLILRGPRRSGKGTALHILKHLVGREQATDMRLQTLTLQFGMEDIVGKQILLMNEATLPRGGDGYGALEMLLKIVGQDPVSVARKHKKSLTAYQPKCKITMTVNAMPHIPDNSHALEGRMMIIDYREDFTGREDYSLRDKLELEKQGIIVWALEGLRRLRARGPQGRFSVPIGMKEALAEWRTMASPMASFVEECCEQQPGAESGKAELFDCWTRWGEERGIKPMPKARFVESLRNSAPFITSETYTKGGHKFSVYKGITIRSWAAKQYLGKLQ